MIQKITLQGSIKGNGSPQKIVDGGLNLILLEVVAQPDADCVMQLFEDSRPMSAPFRYAEDAIASLPGNWITGNVLLQADQDVNVIWEARMIRGNILEYVSANARLQSI